MTDFEKLYFNAEKHIIQNNIFFVENEGGVCVK